MLAIYESLVESAQNTAKKNIEGQMSLFDLAAESIPAEASGGRLPDVAPFDKRIELEMEKEMLGVYLTDHPLNNYKEKMEQISTLTADDIAHLATGETGLQEGSDEIAGVMERSFARERGGEIRDGMKCVMSGMISGQKYPTYFYIRLAKTEDVTTVSKPATAIARLLIAPSISPISIAFAVPMA